jgi:hypothetical protein
MTASSVARPVAVMGFQNRSIIGPSNHSPCQSFEPFPRHAERRETEGY